MGISEVIFGVDNHECELPLEAVEFSYQPASVGSGFTGPPGSARTIFRSVMEVWSPPQTSPAICEIEAKYIVCIH